MDDVVDLIMKTCDTGIDRKTYFHVMKNYLKNVILNSFQDLISVILRFRNEFGMTHTDDNILVFGFRILKFHSTLLNNFAQQNCHRIVAFNRVKEGYGLF